MAGLGLRGQAEAVPHVVSDRMGISSREQNRAIRAKGLDQIRFKRAAES